jgi:dTDP-4-dehydrorhamnose reductase
MKILLTGAYGQLGREIMDWKDAYPDLEILGTDIDTLDITDRGAVDAFFRKSQPGWLINGAAYTAVDQAEDEPVKAEQINAMAPGILAEACKKYQARMIHVSTDYVFDGHGYRPYREDDPVHPQSVYGHTKWLGEQKCLEAHPESLIIRTSWLYSMYGKNFVKTILRLGREKESLRVVFDQVGTPTYARDLARAILEIVNGAPTPQGRFIPGIYHYANEGACSWYDFARAILEMAHVACPVIPVRSEEFKSKASRPHYSILDKSKIKKVYALVIPEWRESLAECIQKLKAEKNGL